MAASSSSSFSLSSSSAFVDARAHAAAAASPQCVSLPTLPPPQPAFQPTQGRVAKTTAYCRKVSRNVAAMATGEVPVLTREEPPPTTTTTQLTTTTSSELPEIIQTIQTAWDKVEDKVAVSSLAAAAAVGLVGSVGMIGAIDRLPLIPGALELVGIGYTGWFAYRYLVFKPDREALFSKVKALYKEIIGSSS